MEITEAQYRVIEHCLPTQRGNVRLSNLRVLNAILYVAEQGFQSRVLLDAQFAAGARFGAGGTPAAVIVDAEGRIASDVSVGAEAVLALAGGRTRVAETAG